MRVFVTDTAGLIGDPLAQPLLAADHPVTGPDGVSDDGGVARMRARRAGRVGTSGPSDAVGTPAGRHRLVACAGSTPGGTPPGRSRAFAPLLARPPTRAAAPCGA
jgi:nucleoside-diphosphate-sugar epimerase